MKVENLPECFDTDLVLRWVSDGKWRVHEPFTVHTMIGTVTVPAGAFTDGPSIPKIPALYEKFRDRAWPAAVVHDWLYCDDPRSPAVDRETADEVFHWLMDRLYDGWLDRVRNDEEWAGVRLGGESHFKKGE